MDAIEFFTTLMDRIDGTTKKLDCENKVLKTLFQVILTTQIVCCENPAHVSEHKEVFYSLDVDVKGRRSLRESLADLTRGETLRGEDQYFCSYCGKKVDALKRYFFKAMPHTLIVHLKRFEFHIGRLKIIKLNDNYEFPLELDLSPYMDRVTTTTTTTTMATLPDDMGQSAEASASASRSSAVALPPINISKVRPPPATNSAKNNTAQYRLSGVVVHSGTPDEGHYYSLRRVPSASSSSSFSSSSSSSSSSTPPLGDKNAKGGEDKEDVWLELNDATVTPFDPKDIPERCYGGPDLARNGLKAYSAYILFYDRIESKPGDSDSTSRVPLSAASPLERKAASTPATPALSMTPSSSPPLPSSPSSVTASPRGRPSDILRREQEHAAKYTFLFGAQHMSFVWGLAHELPDKLQGFKLLLYVLVNIVARVSDRLSLFPRWFAAVKGFLCSTATSSAASSARECARWLLRALIADNAFWKDMLHGCPVPMVHLCFIDIVVTAFRLVSSEEQSLYEAAVPAKPPIIAQSTDVWTSNVVNGSHSSEDGSLAILFIDKVLESVNLHFYFL